MKMLMIVSMPHHKFNAAVKDGTAGAKLGKIMDALNPESAYFAKIAGRRTGFLVVNLTDTAQIPSFCEPWFLTFEADVQLHPVMLPADLQRAGLDTIGQQWS